MLAVLVCAHPLLYDPHGSYVCNRTYTCIFVNFPRDVHWRMEYTSWGLLRVHGASAGGVFENSWAWVADHAINGEEKRLSTGWDGVDGNVFLINHRSHACLPA